MGATATNYAHAAYQLTSDDTDAIDKMGFLNAYMMYLGLLLEKSEKEGGQSKGFLLAAKVAGVTMKQDKDHVLKSMSREGYEKLFPRMVVRSCETIRANPR